MPAVVDGDTAVVNSGAILLYPAEKTSQFLSKPASRGERLARLMFTASGIGPVTSQCVHFKRDAPETIAYALNRHEYAAWRHWRLIGQRAPKRIAASGPLVVHRPPLTPPSTSGDPLSQKVCTNVHVLCIMQ